MVNRRPQLKPPIADRRDRRSTEAGRHSPLARIPVSASPSASPPEAAAIVAALERFMRDTGAGGSDSAAGPGVGSSDPWARLALLEGVGREDEWPSAWGDPHPWAG